MFSSLFRPKRSEKQSLFSSPGSIEQAQNTLRASEAGEPELVSDEDVEDYDVEEEDVEDAPDSELQAPLLPLFSAPHLDSLPAYQLTHDLRLLVSSRCETTLTWEQLRSPQVSQFLLKPIQQIIHTRHLSRATLFALMVNCLQFDKEAASNPGISGASRTRVMVCELLAIKLLKEYSIRSLIDALSYDFHPLQGMTSKPSTGASTGPSLQHSQRARILLKDVRISCLEIAIRAQAKRFLAHPLVVQQLEALWAGTIVFYSAADTWHRLPARNTPRQTGIYGATDTSGPAPIAGGNAHIAITRRTVTLYNPKDASLFKLSRLRVPRYRQLLSTLSYAILLCLFLTLLQQRPLDLTALEVLFWFWSAGFMLDEIVGFNEQGFSLYLMSFWNVFDVGILLLLLVYYVLRLYGAILPRDQKPYAAGLAYDALAANAVLLFPRLFSVLDHYRYFSQILIAFRMMAADLIAVLILIIIACSGFFVAFTFSFGGADASPSSVAYALFQMVMGFTPAAWSLWDRYNLLGKIILTMFLFMCQFLVVTILITVLTNSFMAIVKNAHEEHQFLFAVNTISMVKSDALFSYVAPTNVLAWAITPLRFVMTFQTFLKLNRTVIKVTHFPILFSIYLYERTVLRTASFEPTDLVRGRFSPLRPSGDGDRSFEPFAPRNKFRVREPSVATYQKDRALDQVFDRHNETSTHRETLRTRARQRVSATNVSDWMQNIGDGGSRAPPEDQDQKVVEDLESRRLWPGTSRRRRNRGLSGRDFTETTRSFASDPEEFINPAFDNPDDDTAPLKPYIFPQRVVIMPTQTDIEVQGDDELSSEGNAGDTTEDRESPDPKRIHEVSFPADTGLASSAESPPTISRPSTSRRFSRKNSPTRAPRTPRRHHSRNPSAATILYNPSGLDAAQCINASKSSSSPKNGRSKTGTATPNRRRPTSSLRVPPQPIATRPRPVPQATTGALSVPDNGIHWSLNHIPRRQRRPVPLTMGLGSDIGDNEALGGGFVGGVPGSFTTQMAYAMGGIPQDRGNDNRDMLSRLVLARMKTLEESFRDVLNEVKDLRHAPGRREKNRPATSRRATASTNSPRHSVDTHGAQEESPRKGSDRRLQTAFEPKNEPLSEEENSASPSFRASSV